MNYYILVRESDGYIISHGFNPQPLETIPVDIPGTFLKQVTEEDIKLFTEHKYYKYDIATNTIIKLSAKPQDGNLWVWENGSWQNKTPIEQKWARLRMRRNSLLAKADIAVIRQLEQNGTVPLDLKQYRQQLRDLPEQTQDPDQVVWPIPPEDYGLTPTSSVVTIG